MSYDPLDTEINFRTLTFSSQQFVTHSESLGAIFLLLMLDVAHFSGFIDDHFD
jgi:hypothetical protein